MAKWMISAACPVCSAKMGDEHSDKCLGFRCFTPVADNQQLTLQGVLDLALDQALQGKGAERHGNGKPFDQQPMLEIGRMVGPGFCLGQAMKKAQEASRMEPEAAKREILGAINYLAGAYLLLEK
jgi:hypothetical protein